MPFVLDNSVVCGWLLENQASAYADGVAKRLYTDHAVAPPLLRLEYADVLRTACKRRRLIAEQAHEAIRHLQELPIEIDASEPDAAQLLSLALQYGLTAHDAAYLELALRLQLPIATTDATLAEAARSAGVGVLQT